MVDGESVFFRLLRMNSPEWNYILIGCLMSAISGASQVAYSILITGIFRVS